MADWVYEFNLRSTELSFLVVGAALEIDNYRLGQRQESKDVNNLSYLLNKITQGENRESIVPEISLVLAYAISGREQFKTYWKNTSSVDEVTLQTNLVAKELKDYKSLSEIKQKELLDFVLRLNQEITDYYNRFHSRRLRLTA